MMNRKKNNIRSLVGMKPYLAVEKDRITAYSLGYKNLETFYL